MNIKLESLFDQYIPIPDIAFGSSLSDLIWKHACSNTDFCRLKYRFQGDNCVTLHVYLYIRTLCYKPIVAETVLSQVLILFWKSFVESYALWCWQNKFSINIILTKIYVCLHTELSIYTGPNFFSFTSCRSYI